MTGGSSRCATLLAIGAGLALVACSTAGQTGSPAGGSAPGAAAGPQAAVPQTASPAIDLRVNLELLAGAHVLLLARTTGAGVGVRTQELGGYGAMVHQNGLTLTGQLAPQKPRASEQLAEHLTAFDQDLLRYSAAAFAKDQNGLVAARTALADTYVPQMAAALRTTNALPEQTGKQLVAQQAQDAVAVVDAQAGGDWNATFLAVRAAYGHARALASAVAVSMAGAQPSAYPGNARSKAADGRSAIESLLQEQTYLTGFASSAAVGARGAEQQGAQQALQQSTAELAQAAGAAAGPQAQAGIAQALGGLQGAVLATAQAAAARNAPAQQQAQAKLTDEFPTAYTRPALGTGPAAARALGKALGAMAVAEGGQDYAGAAAACRQAAQSAATLGRELARALVTKAPERFR